MITDEQVRKEYMKMRNKSLIKIRFTPKEKTLLETMMRKEGWGNVSGFIRYKLFGFDPDEKIKLLIDEKDADGIAALLKNCALSLADLYMYVIYRYDKDMAQLYREEGVDLKAWAGKTNKWHSELVKQTEEYLKLMRRVAEALGLESYAKRSPSAPIDYENVTKEELDAEAERMRRESIALGYGDPFKD